jgi:hypothetical protein
VDWGLIVIWRSFVVRIHQAMLSAALAALVLSGCASEEGESGPKAWTVQTIWPLGTRPVATPTSSAVLFTQEQAPAGLYLLLGDAATHLNPAGPAARTDYSWSRDGSHFCFSGPGESGEADAGIFVAGVSSPTEFQRIWDRGSHPRFMADGQGVVCAGPEDGSDAEGIWYITLSNQARDSLPLAERGLSPEVSPDGFKIAYLMTGGTLGRILVVLDLETARRDTVAGEVLDFSWLGDSQRLVFESFVDGVLHVNVTSDAGSVPIAVGTLPAGFPQSTDFVFTGLEGDRIAGLWIAGPTHAAERISVSGTWASPAGLNRIVAQDSTGIIELTR